MTEHSLRSVRAGIDVGGTFTKAVAIDGDTGEILGKASVLTTHNAPEGVAKGVLEVFDKIIREGRIDPGSVTLVAHSTTQATNALLEGDVSPVGIIGIGKGLEGFIAKRQTRAGNIELAPGRMLKTFQEFVDSSSMSKEAIRKAIETLRGKGAGVIVASEPFAVEDDTREATVTEVSSEYGIPATAASDISKLYGLTVRTRTAVVNASILPKMRETADLTEETMRRAGISARFMIMRGDGGVSSIDTMRKRPILTLLSGPSASVAGALMYLRISDGIFFEVGGTSTNVGVIRGGRPMVKYVNVGSHRTYLSSLDVRVLGVAGGSMPRLQGRQLVDVGPRSAHIAGLSYSAFARTEEITNPQLTAIQPKPGDPTDYVAIKCPSKVLAITNTCAANALGITKPGDFAHGNPESAKRALAPLAERLGFTIEETAIRILGISAEKVVGVVDELIKEYELAGKFVVLAGGGGGAAALIPFVAKRMKLDYEISENAEVISSIGDALASVREVVERTIINATPNDTLQVRREAEAAAIKAGAKPETVEVFLEVDTIRNIVRAIATGATELRTKKMLSKVTDDEVKVAVARTMNVTTQDVECIVTTELLRVFTIKDRVAKSSRSFEGIGIPLRVLDQEGFVKLGVSGHWKVVQSSAGKTLADLDALLEDTIVKDIERGMLLPSIYLLYTGRIVDYSGLSGVSGDVHNIRSMAQLELEGLKPEERVILIGVKQ